MGVALVAGVLLAAGLAVTPTSAGGAPPPLRAGVGVGDITPPVGTPMFAYTSREAAASGVEPFISQEDFDTNLYAKTFLATVGVHTRLRSRAVVLDSGGIKTALVQVDLGGLPYELHQAVVQRITATGIDRDHLLISATHSHGSVGPIWPATHSGYQILGGDVFDPRIFGLVADGIAESILAADGAVVPAQVGVARSLVHDSTRNRNLEPHFLNPESHATDRDDDLPHSIPAELTVVRIDTADGRPMGLWSAFAIHGTSFGDSMLHFTGDNQAYSERMVEETIRSRAGLGPDDVIVHAQANGAEGDISPRGASTAVGDTIGAIPSADADGTLDRFYTVGPFASAEMAGTRVARAVIATWDAAGASMSATATVDARFTLLSLGGEIVNGEPVGATVALGCGGVVCPDGTELPIDVPGQGAKLPVAVGVPGTLVPSYAPLQAIRVADQLLVSVPFEATKQMGERFEAAVAAAASGVGFDPAGVAVVGLANGYGSYVATPQEYDASYYEGSFTLYGRQQGPRLQAGLVELVSALVAGTPGPAGVPEPLFVDPSIPLTPALTDESGAGAATAQPSTTPRLRRVDFTWLGGDPTNDDPHVRAERASGDGWVLETTDDGYEDLVTHRGNGPHVWTETWEPSVCTPTGTYRFVVAGASGSGDYDVVSEPFEVVEIDGPAADDLVVGDGTLSFRGLYPEPDDEPLRARPRLSVGGRALVRVDDADIIAEWDPAGEVYVATGRWSAAAGVTVESIEDGCGNGTIVAQSSPGGGGTVSGPVGAGAPAPLPATGGDAPFVPAFVALAAVAVIVRRRSRVLR